jgi:hypothetical protein
LWSTDPVVRATADGVFWFATLGQTGAFPPPPDHVALARSTDGEDWTVISIVPAGDKEWFALDATSVWLGHDTMTPTPDYHRIAFDGTILGEAESPMGDGVTGVYVDASGAHFVHNAEAGEYTVPVYRWNGGGPAEQEGALLPTGVESGSALFYTTSVGIGTTPDGGQWIVRTVQVDGAPAIVLRVRRLPDEGVELPISEPGAIAFLPVALVDLDGRLRVVYYDSSGPRGVLRTTLSLTNDWTQGFEPSTLIDPDACPGNGWFPELDSPSGGRRLREYIDISASGRRLHFAWTHAPSAPSRVWTAFLDY